MRAPAPPSVSMGVVTTEIRSVAVVGAGAMGAMYAAHFAATGFDVALVARGSRARALREQGLLVNGVPLAARVVDPDEPASAAADLVIFAVKDLQLEAALDDAAVVMGPHTLWLSVLNGLDSEERIAARFGPAHPLLCIALGMDAQREGREVRFRQVGRLEFGGAVAEGSDAVVRVSAALTRARLAHQTPPDMRHRLWWKFMVNVGINQASAVFRAPYGAFQAPGDARSLMLALMDEVLAVATAEGVALGQADVAAWEAVLAKQPPEGWTSMHQDVVAGRPTEVETFAGRVVALGARHGVPTPYNQAMLWILRR